ncbi:alpha/beta fold hydrolase [Yoonia sp. I 8.24]|uniref:alpha/beta fold hydrolase n=1 Tax=Yoonia sp. I 8.24 TaxID=1537229 RepID=UPI001EDFFF9D|nr:alpha/beta hydrolase [Yoonia sp. I 8.24]MCG3268622.1 alpha/beta hydrolase [Yoonia sp. I 8.24]
MTQTRRDTLGLLAGAAAAATIPVTAQANVKHMQVAGAEIAWESHGSGAPILLLNRFRGTISDWDPAFIDSLAHHHRVITFDSVGVGESGGEVPETLEGAADVAIGLADALGLEAPNILGWSMGGMIAQIVAAKYSARLGRVVLAGTTPSYRTAGTVPAPQEWLATAGKEINTAEDMHFLFYGESESSRAAGLASLERIGGGDAAAGARAKSTMATLAVQAAATRAFLTGEDGAFETLGRISSPVFVANGDQDRAFQVENSLALARAIPNAQLAIYPNSGHAFHFQHIERFTSDVTRFLAR